MKNLSLLYKINTKNHAIQLTFFPEHVCLKYSFVYIWYDWLYQRHVLVKGNPRFPKAKASCYIYRFLVLKQKKKSCKSMQNLIFFFSMFCVFWILRKSVNHTNLRDKTLYNNVSFISLDKKLETKDTFGRGGWNSMRNLVTQGSKYPENTHHTNCPNCIVILTQKYTYFWKLVLCRWVLIIFSFMPVTQPKLNSKI